MTIAYGYILEESERSPEVLWAALMQHPTAVLPTIVPVWTRWRDGMFDLDAQDLEHVRRMGIEPIVYAETTGLSPTDILSGQFDWQLRLLAARGRGALIRILHEPNGALFEWSGWPERVYVDVWQHISVLFHAEGARMAYCVVGRGKRNVEDMVRHWPGEEWVDAVGVDTFIRSSSEPALPVQLAPMMTMFSAVAPGAPFYVFETGIEADVDRRAAFIRSWGELEGVTGILGFDRRIIVPSPPAPRPIDDDWTWNKAMQREWDRLPRG